MMHGSGSPALVLFFISKVLTLCVSYIFDFLNVDFQHACHVVSAASDDPLSFPLNIYVIMFQYAVVFIIT